jgi:hypothetical protein
MERLCRTVKPEASVVVFQMLVVLSALIDWFLVGYCSIF